MMDNQIENQTENESETVMGTTKFEKAQSASNSRLSHVVVFKAKDMGCSLQPSLSLQQKLGCCLGTFFNF